MGRYGLPSAFAVLLISAAAAGSDLPPVVFASRDLGGEPQADRRRSAFERAVQGRLLVREPDGAVRALVERSPLSVPWAPADVMDPDVSFDGSKVVFSGYSEEDAAWRIFEVQVDGSGLRKVTRSDRQVDLSRYGAATVFLKGYDDGDPCYLPDGRICFVSTRYPGIAPDGRLRTTNLYVVNADGSDLHRITSERFGADTPAVEPSTGQIVYSRWWRTAPAAAPGSEPPPPIPPGSPEYGGLATNTSPVVLRGIEEKDFPGVNSWFLASIDPDGTDMAMYSGVGLDRALTQAYKPSFVVGGEVLSLFIPQTPFIGYPQRNGLRRLHRGPSPPQFLGGPQGFPGQFVFDAFPDAAFFPFVYASAAPLPDGKILISAKSFVRSDYGIYLQKGLELPVLLHDPDGSSELDAVPLLPRPLPPKVLDSNRSRLVEEAPRTVEEAFAQGGSFIFAVENIHANAPVDNPLPSAPPIGKSLAIEFYMDPPLSNAAGGDSPILIRRMEVPPDGKLRVELPAGVPLFEVLRRPDGSIPLGRDGQVFHVGGMNFGRAGETNRCVGCHAGHSQMAIPTDPAWTNVAPSAVVRSGGGLPEGDVGNALERLFGEANLTDRRTGDAQTEWAVVRGAEPVSFEMLWSTRVRAREVVLRGIRPDSMRLRDLVVHRFTLETFLDGVEVRPPLVKAADVSPEGTSVALDPSLAFNLLRFTIDPADVTGFYEGQKAVALAEVEVMGQAASEPVVSFRRGDSDCNSRIDISDAILLLVNQFLGFGPLCCQAAGDANDDAQLDITDPVFLIQFMFLGGTAPTPPFPACGPGRDSGLSCDLDVCS